MSEGHSAGIGRNTLLFVGASLFSAAIAIVTVPAYLSVVGTERFGVYIVALLVMSYFGLSDLGLGSAIENAVAKMAPEEVERRSATVWTAVTISVALGIVGGIVLMGVELAPLLDRSVAARAACETRPSRRFRCSPRAFRS